MKNYIKEARKSGITTLSLPSSKYIQKYVINKEHKYVEITYMNGRRGIQSLGETTEQELKQKQEEHFSDMTRKLSSKINEETRWKKSLVFIFSSCACSNFIASNFFAGTLNLACSACWGISIYKPLKLQKELQLASWIYEQKENVNKLIEAQTESKVKTQNIDYSSFPYPKEIIENGINLNNMELLDVKQLKKLKRDVKKKIKKQTSESLEVWH